MIDLNEDSKPPADLSDGRNVTLWGLVINLVLAAGKAVIGIFAGSQALVADGVHSVSDSVTDVAILVGTKYWSAPADASHPYGHGRIETLITAMIGLVLAGVGVGLAWRAVETMTAGHLAPPGWAAFWAACAAIVVKEAVYRWTVRVGRRIRSSAITANAWHHRSDALSSVPVALAVLGAKLRPEWTFLDHVATIVVAALILHAAWGIVWPALKQLADVSAEPQQRENIRALTIKTPGVHDVHRIRTRHMGPGLEVDLHVLVDPELTVRQGHEIADLVRNRVLEQGPEVISVLVHVEPYEP